MSLLYDPLAPLYSLIQIDNANRQFATDESVLKKEELVSSA